MATGDSAYQGPAKREKDKGRKEGGESGRSWKGEVEDNIFCVCSKMESGQQCLMQEDRGRVQSVFPLRVTPHGNIQLQIRVSVAF